MLTKPKRQLFTKSNLLGLIVLTCSLNHLTYDYALGRDTPVMANPQSSSPVRLSEKSEQVTILSDEAVSQVNQCQGVIRRITNRLEAIPNVRVTDSSGFAELIIPYPDASAGLDRRYIFAMEGTGLDQLWQAPELMLRMTRQVIANCAGTAVVTFGRDHSGDSVNVGLFPDGTIKRFSCAPDAERHTRSRVAINWGEQACDL